MSYCQFTENDDLPDINRGGYLSPFQQIRLDFSLMPKKAGDKSKPKSLSKIAILRKEARAGIKKATQSRKEWERELRALGVKKKEKDPNKPKRTRISGPNVIKTKT